jgi:general stress protein 26
MDLVAYVRERAAGVVSTLGPTGEPQAAYLAITATDAGELVFDAKADSRKVANLNRDPRIAIVVGGADGTTLQLEGTADFPRGAELARVSAAYLTAFPQFESSLRDPAIVVVRVTVSWSRFGDFRD